MKFWTPNMVEEDALSWMAKGREMFSGGHRYRLWGGGLEMLRRDAAWTRSIATFDEHVVRDWQPVPAEEPEPDFSGDLTPGQALCAMEAGLCVGVGDGEVVNRLKGKRLHYWGGREEKWFPSDISTEMLFCRTYRVVPDPEAAEEAEREPITLLEPVTVKRAGTHG